ncbi:MAG: tRNA pseudouridine synthase B, partial [Acidobacteriota bacterium]
MDKPAGVTSHDVVGMLRRRFGERQVGHAGTLDPDATGVLVVAVGKATRLLRFVEKTRKGYTGEVVLGSATTTLDAAGEPTATFDMSSVTVEQARRVVAEHLVGDIEQVPPMVSAIRVDGRRLHELAREGIEVERAPRRVTVHRFDVVDWAAPQVLAVEVEC